MEEILLKYIPEHSVQPIIELIKANAVHLKIVNQRVSKHGDYRKHPSGKHQITVNANLNKYRFLITLVHEIAHLVAIEKYGHQIKSHGAEWKHTFQHLMIPFINPTIFPSEVLPYIAKHFKNPTASSDTDVQLSLALKKYDPPTHKVMVAELSLGSTFALPNTNRLFIKGLQRVKRIECVEKSNGKTYLFHPNAEVVLV